MMLMMMGHDCIWETAVGGVSGGGEVGKERILKVKRLEVCHIYIYAVKSDKHCLKKGE
jgi:hypothetical protein